MVTLFYILVGLSIFHFFYDGIIAPALRHGLRYKFFELRDELRRLKIDGLIDEKDIKVYEHLDHFMCNLIHSMSYVSLGNYYRLKKDVDNEDLVKFIKKYRDDIKHSDNKKLIEMDKKIKNLGSFSLLINNGAWFLYLLLPIFIFLIISLFSFGFGKLGRSIARISERLIYTSNNYDDNISMV